jgi:P-type conjugative transfer protein TrbL
MARRFNRNRILTAAIAALLTLAATAATAAAPYDSAPINTFIDTVRSAGGGIHSAAYTAAVWLFWALALVQLSWSAIQLALRGEWTINHVTSLLVKETLFIGFFYWLLTQADPSNPYNIIEMMISNDGANRGLLSFSGSSGGSAGLNINPAGFFVDCVEALHKITNSAFMLGVYSAPWAVAPYALALVSLSFASAFAIAYLLEYFVVLPAGIILLGMGGNSASKPFAVNYVKVLIAVGLKLLCLQVLLANARAYVVSSAAVFDNPGDLASDGFFYHAFMFAGFSAVIFISIKTIPQLAAKLVTGAYFGRVNWREPASFPAAATAGAGAARALTPPPGHGAADVQSITGTVTVQNAGEFIGGGGSVSSSLSSGSATAAREQSSFRGAGFGNYAHDIVFGDDSSTSSIPDARPAGGMSDARPAGGLPDARPTRGMPDARPTGGTPDASPRGGTPDADPRGGTPDASPRGGTPDASPRGGTPDAGPRGGTPDASPRGGTPDAGPRGGTPDASPRGGIPDAHPAGGTPDASPRGGTPDAGPRGGTPDASPRGGTPDASPRGGIPDAHPAGGTPDASPRGGTPDARPTGGMPDARPTGGMPDARPTGGMPDARPTGGMPDARPTGGMPDARPTGGMPDARPTGGMPDARPTGGMPDARPAGGMPDARPAGGMPDARPAGGMPDARPAGGMPDARPAGGMPDARPAGGMPDARPAGGMPDAAPAPTSADMRQAIRDSMQ